MKNQVPVRSLASFQHGFFRTSRGDPEHPEQVAVTINSTSVCLRFWCFNWKLLKRLHVACYIMVDNTLHATLFDASDNVWSHQIPVRACCYTHAIPTKTTLKLIEYRVVLVEITKLQKRKSRSVNSIPPTLHVYHSQLSNIVSKACIS